MQSKGEEEVEEEVEEEEDGDTSAETEGASSSFDSTEAPTEDTQTDKPEELQEETKPEQKADISEKHGSTGEEKPANGTTEINSNSQSATSKKLSLFRRLSFSRPKQPNDRDPAPAEIPVSGVRGEPLSAETARGGAQQKPVPSGARSPRSGACTVL
ncbi:hypothetical protein PBY51_016595 [Eleginops maclovinus]|uniref:Uncharacterized protein n=1 Tax=Eleginops maclovinus TaxID=56733 RepID=A0AAN7WL79_ELEMC|nr:hypothetical protein PBY51_016595 [Eleginops maclovinus]